MYKNIGKKRSISLVFQRKKKWKSMAKNLHTKKKAEKTKSIRFFSHSHLSKRKLCMHSKNSCDGRMKWK